MNADFVELLQCPACSGQVLNWRSFENSNPKQITNGVVWCLSCNNWYPIEEGLLEFLTGELAYQQDRQQFWLKYQELMQKLGLVFESDPSFSTEKSLQRVQQKHSDWYAKNDIQTYEAYEQMPFWKSIDLMTFAGWKSEILPGRRLLDVGCAEGRSTFKILDLDLDVIAFDISKSLVRQAYRRYEKGNYQSRAIFFVADAHTFPFKDGVFDYVLVYGVLHHLPDPGKSCREIARVLKPGGVYFGSENNQTIFRKVFELLQKIIPIWHEEAGPEALISSALFEKHFSETGMTSVCDTRVFIPPHLVNPLPEQWGYQLIKITDCVGQALPFIKDNGGLITIRAEKKTDSGKIFIT